MRVKVLFGNPIPAQEKLAEEIAMELGIKCDKIPQAYPCENEKVTFIGFDANLLTGGAGENVQTLCERLTTSNTKYVAFFVTTVTGRYSTDKLKNLLKKRGIHVYDDTYVSKRQFLFLNGGMPNKDTVAKIRRWAHEVVHREAEEIGAVLPTPED